MLRGGFQLAFQQVPSRPEPTWPTQECRSSCIWTRGRGRSELDVQHERALALGARLLFDRFDDPEEPLRVYADPAGHPFCIFVG